MLLDGDTGLILKHNNLPAGPAGNDASIPAELIVLQPLNQTMMQNATTTPFTQPGLRATIALNNSKEPFLIQ